MTLALVAGIVLLVFLIRAIFGFGDALAGMPLLVMLIGVHQAAPLMAMLALVMAAMILIKNLKTVRWDFSLRLILPALVGIPVGLYYLTQIDERIINAVLAAFIIIFSAARMVKISKQINPPGIVTAAVGFVSGVLGGAYNTSGPPVIMLLSAKGMSPQAFRSTLQSFFFSTGVVIVAGHLLWGNVTMDVFNYFWVGLPAVVIAFIAGEKLINRFDANRFYRWVYVLLILIGIALLIKAVA
jgi:uncharacterized membrane protein YfcA